MATNESPDIIVIVESKLSEDKVPKGCSDLEIPAYVSPYRRDRNAHGGGIIVWVKTELARGEIEEAETNGHEVLLWYTVKQSSGKHVVMCATYRPPSADDTSVADYFDRVLPTMRRRGDAVILIGGFNWHSESWLGSNKRQMRACMPKAFSRRTVWSSWSTCLRAAKTLRISLSQTFTRPGSRSLTVSLSANPTTASSLLTWRSAWPERRAQPGQCGTTRKPTGEDYENTSETKIGTAPWRLTLHRIISFLLSKQKWTAR